jgi:hypothetical protein
VATNSQGVVVQFAGDDLGEVLSVSVDGVQADSVEITPRSQATRDKIFRPADFDYGTVTATCLDFGNFSLSNIGESGDLVITGAAVSLNFEAILQSLAWTANVGELQRITFVFKLGAKP